MINVLLKKTFLGLLLGILCAHNTALPVYAQGSRPLRIISLAPSTTEILFALGLDEEIVAVSSYCNYPAQATDKPNVGNFSHPNLERISALKPDYIMCTGLEQAPTIAELKRLGFNVYVADPSTMSELYASIEDIGRLTNTVHQAAVLLEKMKNDVATISSKVALLPPENRVKVFIEIWHDPLMTAGKGSFIDELITIAGGINIAHDTIRPYSIFSQESLIAKNPSCIIMTYMDKKAPLALAHKRFGWNTIDAIRHKRVFNDINPDILLRPGPRVTEGLQEIHRRLYPEEQP